MDTLFCRALDSRCCYKREPWGAHWLQVHLRATGLLWTDTEEWPGNQRILEVDDLDGDQLVIRYDYFGDEATNKDKKNSLSFANGGCGTNQWPEKRVTPATLTSLRTVKHSRTPATVASPRHTCRCARVLLRTRQLGRGELQ